MKRLLLLPLLIGLTSPAQARVDPKVHKLCKDVKDYLGCVKAQSGEVKPKPSASLGNRCPIGHAYAGGGQCGDVVPAKSGIAIMTSPAYAIWSWEKYNAIEAIGIWNAGWTKKPRTTGFYRLGQLAPAGFDPQCPKKEPALYTNSSCDEKPKAPTLSELEYFFKGGVGKSLQYWNEEFEKLYGVKNLATDAKNYGSSKKRKPVACLSGKLRPNHPMCRDDEDKIMSPMDMD